MGCRMGGGRVRVDPTPPPPTNVGPKLPRPHPTLGMASGVWAVTVLLSPVHSTLLLSPGHNTLAPEHSALLPPLGHITRVHSPEHNTLLLPQGYTTLLPSPVDTRQPSPGHSTLLPSPCPPPW